MEKRQFVTPVKSMNSALGILQLSELNSFRIFALSSWHNLHPPQFNPLNAELNPICHLLALLGVHHILHVSGIRVKVT
jgi:hypothetical protein